MSNNQQYPYQYDPYGQYDQYGQAQQRYQDEPTQQWEGSTWDTQVQPSPVPQQGYEYGGPQPQQQWSYEAAPQGPTARGSAPDPAAQSPQGLDVGAAARTSQGLDVGAAARTSQGLDVGVAAQASRGLGVGAAAQASQGLEMATDAQRARAEGRSPIIEPGMQPAALTAVLALLLAGGAAIGSYALLVPLVVLQAVTAAGWFRLNGMWPARQGIALAFMGGVVADVVLLVAGRDNGPAAILGTLGVWVLLTLVLQLRSHADPDERMYGLMATVASAALAILAAGHLAAESEAVTVGGVAVAVAIVARALPLPTIVSVVVALLAATGAGIAAGGITGFGSGGALLGLGAGACAVIGHRVASYDYPSRFVHMTAGVALPLAAAAPAIWLLGRAFG